MIKHEERMNYYSPHLRSYLQDERILAEISEIQQRGWCLIEVEIHHPDVYEESHVGWSCECYYYQPETQVTLWNVPQDHQVTGNGYYVYKDNTISTVLNGKSIIHGQLIENGTIEIFHFWAWCPDEHDQNPWATNFATNTSGSNGNGQFETGFNWDYNFSRWTEDTKECMLIFDLPHATQQINQLESNLLNASCSAASEYTVKSVIDRIILDHCEAFFENQENSESGLYVGQGVGLVETLNSITDEVESHEIYQLGEEICLVCEEYFDPDDCYNSLDECTTIDYEECVCEKLQDYSLINFESKYEIDIPSSVEGDLLNQVTACSGDGFEEEVFTILSDKYVNLALENISDGHRIRVLDCNSYQWNLVGSGWVSCLNPTNMEVEIGNTGIDFFIDMGCMSYTIPNTRVNDQGQIIQTISDEEASSCAAMASNLASVAVKLFMTIIPDYKLFNTDFIVKGMLKKVYKKAYSEAMEKTSCGNNPNLYMWSGSIASCTNSNCPSGGSTPIYSDNLIEVTEENILGECH